MQPRQLILIEFNELCPRLLSEFMARGWLPQFRRLEQESAVFTTDACEREPNLEPWIQWPTVHSGMTFEEHGVFHLGDGRRLHEKCVAELLSDHGIRVGVFGSMNLNYAKLNGYVIPDPWDRAGQAYPDDLQLFYRTVARQVQESSRNEGLTPGDVLRFGLFLVRHGLTLGSAWCVLRQLLTERCDHGVRWRRAMVLDRLQYDVFRTLNRRHQVRFATFFCNSTAHFQHYHWRNMEPSSFSVPPDQEEHDSLRNAIPDGYRAMDQLVGRFLRDYPDAVLVLCTALSQQPWTETTKCTFRPQRFEDLLSFAGIDPASAAVKPVMAEQFFLEFRSPEQARFGAERLLDLAVSDEQLMAVRLEGSGVFAGCRATDTAVLDRPVRRRSEPARPARRFCELFYKVHTTRSGRHHPDGVLWFRTGSHRVVEKKVPLTAIAPTILAHFGVPQPRHMRGVGLTLVG